MAVSSALDLDSIVGSSNKIRTTVCACCGDTIGTSTKKCSRAVILIIKTNSSAIVSRGGICTAVCAIIVEDLASGASWIGLAYTSANISNVCINVYKRIIYCNLEAILFNSPITVLSVL